MCLRELLFLMKSFFSLICQTPFLLLAVADSAWLKECSKMFNSLTSLFKFLLEVILLFKQITLFKNKEIKHNIEKHIFSISKNLLTLRACEDSGPNSFVISFLCCM